MGNEDAKLEPPCKGCKYRHINCHSTCFMYKEWKNQTEVVKAIIKKEKKTWNDFNEVLKYKVRKR